MSARRGIAAALVLVFLIGAFALAGCASQPEDATFIGYRQRPSDQDPVGIAIIRLEDGQPAEAECTYTSLENGTPVMVTKSGDTYEIVSSSPDWE